MKKSIFYLAFCLCLFGEAKSQNKYKYKSFVAETMFNKSLFLKANTVVYLSDSLTNFSNQPTHITITNYQNNSVFLKFEGGNKFEEVKPLTTVSLPLVNLNKAGIKVKYKKAKVSKSEAKEQYNLLANNFTRLIEENNITLQY